jgi:adenine-specific DNA-methyltransferase
MIEIDLSEFPTTRYQGSKRKILPWISEIVQEIEFNTVLDTCGGSSVVSFLFKKLGKEVTYNDKLKFNYIMGKALIENQGVRFTNEDVTNLLSSINNNTERNFITQTFEDIYYPDSENRWLDGINTGIINMNHYTGQTLEYKKYLAYYALFQASLSKRPFNLFHRKNLNLRTNDVERNFGNKTTWEKSFEAHFTTFIEEANNMVFNSNTDCRAINESILEINELDYDLVYIDPPYINKEGTNETSDYLKCYHFLEGMSNYDTWQSYIALDTVNKRFDKLEEQNDFNRETIHKVFEEIISKFRGSSIILSYKFGGSPSISYLVTLMKKHKNFVYTRSQHYKYALNRQNGDARKNREVLIIGI